VRLSSSVPSGMLGARLAAVCAASACPLSSSTSSARIALPSLAAQLHTSAALCAVPEKAQKAKAKERAAANAAQLEKVAPQQVQRPERSPEQLADAAARVKEYSRRCMADLRRHQHDQKLRKQHRYGACESCH
jgi:hypothetical protein